MFSECEGEIQVDEGIHFYNDGGIIKGRLFYGNLSMGHNSKDDGIPYGTCKTIKAGAGSHPTFRAALPPLWRDWYDGLSSTRQAGVRSGVLATPMP